MSSASNQNIPKRSIRVKHHHHLLFFIYCFILVNIYLVFNIIKVVRQLDINIQRALVLIDLGLAI